MWYFLWLQHSNEVNTVTEVNSSTDMKEEATGSAAGLVWEQGVCGPSASP